MKIQIAQNEEDIIVVPSLYKNLENPPKFIFRSPNSQDCLNFFFGGNNVFEAVCNCFKGFENKIELYNGDKEIQYSSYKEFVNVGLSGDIAIIHSECMNAVAKRLFELIEQGNATEKKSQLPTNSIKKGQEVQQTIPNTSKTKEQ